MKATKAAVSRDLLFTGIARSVQAFDNQGFKNFKIVTLYIRDGIVEKIEYSDPYANYEAIARLELSNENAVHNLNANWKAGATLVK